MTDKERSESVSSATESGRKYIFGPVNSRRLGLSLGVDLLPDKICSYDCLYCEVGLTKDLTCERKEYVPTHEVIEELTGFFKELSGGRSGPVPDVITVTGTGEPTLHTGIGEIIGYIKRQSEIPVAVLTNGSMLSDPNVRLELMAADVVVPSLDSALPESFRKINRPARECVGVSGVVDGLAAFVEEFGGEVWLEILLAEGVNDSEADIAALVEAVRVIRPTKVQLNTVVRPPAETWARPVSAAKLADVAAKIRTCPVEIVADFSGNDVKGKNDISESDIEKMLKRRPCTILDICDALGLEREKAEKLIDDLIGSGRIREKIHDERRYYQSSND